MSTATLEFVINTGGTMRAGFTALRPGPAPMGFDTIHARTELAEHLDPLPLCWVAEGKQRGATVEEWEISVDHGALPSYAVIDEPTFVTCTDCKEWIHA